MPVDYYVSLLIKYGCRQSNLCAGRVLPQCLSGDEQSYLRGHLLGLLLDMVRGHPQISPFSN